VGATLTAGKTFGVVESVKVNPAQTQWRHHPNCLLSAFHRGTSGR
jgi:hypothetical protein